jgi:glutaredoxin
MNKKILMVVLAIVVLGVASFLIFKNKKEEAQKTINSSEMIFFYGQGCPHCVNVEKFLEENRSVEEKVKFEKLEVWKSKENTQLMIERARNCGLSEKNLGVPLFWDGSNCLIGDTDIIDFLKNKSGI